MTHREDANYQIVKRTKYAARVYGGQVQMCETLCENGCYRLRAIKMHVQVHWSVPMLPLPQCNEEMFADESKFIVQKDPMPLGLAETIQIVDNVINPLSS